MLGLLRPCIGQLCLYAGFIEALVASRSCNLWLPLFALTATVVAVMQQNIVKASGPEDWRYREAATFAFGSILEGPSVEQLAKLSVSGFGFLLNAMRDTSTQVRHTTAWTIGMLPCRADVQLRHLVPIITFIFIDTSAWSTAT